ncbi:hypothetical protein MIR68_000630 [Amoeboaphelidium protococcarum]|nr:hypothetical protein MIR68_000630 [Amoeboaphelidium protococcarum]
MIFSNNWWILIVESLISTVLMASLGWYMLIQRRHRKSYLQNKLDFIILAIHISAVIHGIFEALVVALADIEQNWAMRDIYHAISAFFFTTGIAAYVQYVYIRGKPILEDTKYFNFYRLSVMSSTVIFMFNGSLSVIRSFKVQQIQALVEYSYIITLAFASALLIACDLYSLRSLYRYTSALNKIVSSSNSYSYDIIARYGVRICSISLAATLPGMVSVMFSFDLGYAICLAIISSLLTTAVVQMVLMKSRLVEVGKTPLQTQSAQSSYVDASKIAQSGHFTGLTASKAHQGSSITFSTQDDKL